jgi:alanyl-tRNA synthetase
MNVQDIRKLFLQYFADRDHTIVRSAPLIPQGDPTLFFTNAGMVQFKNVFSGKEKRAYTRATSVQKCMRVSGKHNDLENVGRTRRHHTFFEMLGNFSFGDYFKEEAIEYGWDFLTRVMGLPAERLLATVYRDDDEAFDLWRRYLPAERIARCGRADNYWSMGDVGPNGPCAEIHWDLGDDYTPDNEPDPWGFGHDAGRYMEIWNLVFMQYFTDREGNTTALPRPCVDTGMGLERLAVVMQGAESNYETDELAQLTRRGAELAGLTGDISVEQRTSLRVLADHGRATAFLFADGVMPSNVDRGYVLRRVMRRAIRHGVKLGIDRPFLHELATHVVEVMGDAYPELVQWREKIERFTLAEEETFRRTMHRGLERLDLAFEQLPEGSELPGETVFVLHAQDGFPPDLTAVIASERGFGIDQVGYTKAMEEHRAVSGGMGTGDAAGPAPGTGAGFDGQTTTFCGYDQDAAAGQILALQVAGVGAQSATEGQGVAVVLDRTPMYAERGGQVGDTGTLRSDDAEVRITDTVLDGETIVHVGEVVRGTIEVGQTLDAGLDLERRGDIQRNHTATHLLHAALRRALGDHVAQQGSHVAPDRLRFDFSHVQAATPEQLAEVEGLVNAQIRADLPVDTVETSYDDAVSRGAMALFGEKYGDDVRMVEVPGTSVELCGGTHCSRTGEIGLCKVISEGSVAQGVRRLEAVTGRGAEEYVRELEGLRAAVAGMLKAQPGDVHDRVARLVADRRALARQIDELKARLASGDAGGTTDPVEVAGVQVIAAEVEADAKVLREQADRLMEKLGSGVVVLAARDERSARIVVKVSRDLTDRFHAGKIVAQLAADVGGKGGGRPDMAQAGGKAPDGLPAALERVASILENA